MHGIVGQPVEPFDLACHGLSQGKDPLGGRVDHAVRGDRVASAIGDGWGCRQIADPLAEVDAADGVTLAAHCANVADDEGLEAAT